MKNICIYIWLLELGQMKFPMGKNPTDWMCHLTAFYLMCHLTAFYLKCLDLIFFNRVPYFTNPGQGYSTLWISIR